MKKLFTLSSLVLILCLVLGGISAGVVNAATLKAQIGSCPPNWFPVTSTQREAKMLFELTYDELITFDNQGNPVPRMAKSWEVSEDGTVYTFHLRKGIKFHDGFEFTAEDVKFTYTLMASGEIGSFLYNNVKTIKGVDAYYKGNADEVEGIKVIDDYTVQFELEKPDNSFLYQIPAPIIPKHLYAGMEITEIPKSDRAKKMIGTGPYMLTGYLRDQNFEFKRFEDFYLGKPKIEKIVLKVVNPTVAVAMLQRGELDYIPDVPPEEIKTIEEMQNARIVKAENKLWPWLLLFNCDREYLNQKVRKAFAYAVNKEAYVNAVLNGYATTDPLIFKGAEWAIPEEYPHYKYNPDKAKELLTEAGWDFDREVEIIYYPGTPQRAKFAVVFQDYLRKIGVKVKVTKMDVGRWVELTNPGHHEKRDFEIGLTGAGMTLHPRTLEIQLKSDGGNNRCNYHNPRVDELFVEGRRAVDQDKRNKCYQELNKILVDELPWLVFANADVISAFSNRIKNVKFNPNIPGPYDPSRYLDVHEWTIEE